MVLPAPVYAVKAVGWAQGVTSLILGFKELRTISTSQLTSSYIVSPSTLLVYRTCMLVLGLFVGIRQLLRRGPVVFIYFTVWNWWLLTFFFLASAWTSARTVLVRRRTDRSKQHADKSSESFFLKEDRADALGLTAATLFQVVTPMAFVIDSMTWLVLIPMLEARSAVTGDNSWRPLMYCFSSYMQHGANAAMIFGEILLNKTPALLIWGNAWISIWTSIFGVWSTLFYIKTGTFIYPFLDAHRPYAWVAYVGLYLVHWTAYFAFVGMIVAKDTLARRWLDRSPTTAKKVA